VFHYFKKGVLQSSLDVSVVLLGDLGFWRVKVIPPLDEIDFTICKNQYSFPVFHYHLIYAKCKNKIPFFHPHKIIH
jgi:hypothetical protein